MKTYPIPAQLLQEIVNHFRQQPWIVANDILVRINEIVVSADQVPAPKSNGGIEIEPANKSE